MAGLRPPSPKDARNRPPTRPPVTPDRSLMPAVGGSRPTKVPAPRSMSITRGKAAVAKGVAAARSATRTSLRPADQRAGERTAVPPRTSASRASTSRSGPVTGETRPTPAAKSAPPAKTAAPGQQKKVTGAKSAKSLAPGRQKAPARPLTYGGKGMDQRAVAGIVARSKAKYGRMPSRSAVAATYGRNVARAAKAKTPKTATPTPQPLVANSITEQDAKVKAFLGQLRAAAASGQKEVTINGERWATNPETIAQTEANIARDAKARIGSSVDYAVPKGTAESNPRELPNGAPNPAYRSGVDIYGMTPAQQRLIASGDQVYDGPGRTKPGPKNKGFENSLALLKGG